MRNCLVKFSSQPKIKVGLALFLALSLFSELLLNAMPVEARPEPEGSQSLPPVSSLYFEETGHLLSSYFLDYWQTQGGYMEFGPPISEEYVDPLRGKTIQYFGKARFELAPLPRERGWKVELGVINSEILASRLPWNDDHARALKPLAKGYDDYNTKFFKQTGHSVTEAFYDRWTDANGIGNRRNVTQSDEIYFPITRYGLPISEPYTLNLSGTRYKAQDFERVRMLQTADGSVLLDSIGQLTPGIDREAIARVGNQNGATPYSRKTMPRWVDVNLTNQTAIFLEAGMPVRRNLITSGEWKFETPIGSFPIWSRVPNERMKNGKPGEPDYYDLSGVLYTQYFTVQGHALHYAWWRSTFGYRGSHGCINQDINTSRFAWDFLTIGDKVVIHY